MAIVAGTTALTAYMLDPAMEQIFLKPDAQALLVIPLLVVGLSVIKAVASYVQVVMMSHIGQSIVARLQCRLVRKLLAADLSWIGQRHTGTLISSLINDAQKVQDATAQVMTAIIRDGLTMIGLVIVMFYQDWALASIGIFVVLPGAIAIQKLAGKTRSAASASMKETGTLTALMDDALKGLREVRAYGQEDHEVSRIGNSIEKRLRHVMATIKAKTLGGPVAEALSGAGIAAAIIYAGWRGMEGELGLNNFVSFLAAMMMAYQPMRAIANTFARLHEGAVAAERMYEIIDTKPQINSPSVPESVHKPVTGTISFRQASFSYSDQDPILQDITIDMPSGTTTAIVGPSGSGKSSLLNLIPRFFDVVSGQVLVDNIDVRSWDLTELRKQIAIVAQKPFLFDDTVAANIAYGQPQASHEEIVSAAQKAAAHEFIMQLPEGYQTLVGESGSRLSGGQQQRIAIARAMLKDAPILLLDEATSALDNASERIVQHALQTLMRGRTTILIAHRLSTVAHADQILVLKDGKLHEQGDHESLLKKQGIYAELFRNAHEKTS
ncbi:MAG: ABC transporter ATP-binding protein [Alphaproteobacteria bacterium]|nr:ABC transporter ATP-binding protein [Alphaproteobacteria bacterium]